LFARNVGFDEAGTNGPRELFTEAASTAAEDYRGTLFHSTLCRPSLQNVAKARIGGWVDSKNVNC
jgi:hypothetical protein